MQKYFVLYDYTMLTPSTPAGQKSTIIEMDKIDMVNVEKECQVHLEDQYKHSSMHKMGGFDHLRVYTILSIQKL